MGINIYELTGSAFVESLDNILIIRDVNCLYDDQFRIITELPEDVRPYYFENKLWLCDYKSSLSSTCDSFGKTKVKPYYLPKTIKTENFFFRVQTKGKRGIEKYSINDELLEKLAIRTGQIVTSGELIFTREARGENILAFNLDLTKNWQVKNDKSCFSKAPIPLGAPQYFEKKNLLVVNLGENNDFPRGDFEINAYHAKTGELAWQQIVSTTPDCSSLYGDKVYAIVSGDIIILDAATGSILHQVAHGLNDPKDDYPMANFIYPCQQGLMLVSPKHGLVQIRTVDGLTILQNIHVPLPYTTSFHPPITYEGKTYLGLTHADSYDNTMKGAILVLENDLEINDEQAQKGIVETEAQIVPRPPTLVELIKNESGEDVYRVSIEHDALKSNAASKTLDDLIRFSTIALKETAFKYGSYTSSTETNKNHHGQLLLSVKSGGLQKTTGLNEEQLLEKLQVIKERVERNLADTGVQAGDGSSAFVVDVQLVE